MQGTLWKSTSSYVGSMEKRYCVLVGTLVLDFESEDDFLSGAPPKAEGEVIGVSVWKGDTERGSTIAIETGDSVSKGLGR